MERKDSSKRDELSSTRKGSNRNPYANQPVKGKRKTKNSKLELNEISSPLQEKGRKTRKGLPSPGCQRAWSPKPGKPKQGFQTKDQGYKTRKNNPSFELEIHTY